MYLLLWGDWNFEFLEDAETASRDLRQADYDNLRMALTSRFGHISMPLIQNDYGFTVVKRNLGDCLAYFQTSWINSGVLGVRLED